MKLFQAKYPLFLKWLYPNRISRITNSEAIYLTFDDGPVPEVTPWVLDLLKSYNAKATFFCIGENAKKHPEIFQRILVEGHLIGNHTYNHLNGWKTGTQAYFNNTNKAAWTFQQISEENHTFFRPPFGKIKNSQAKILVSEGYKIVMWDVISGDYDQDFSAEKCYQNVVKNAAAGSTIVFHDSKKAFSNLKEILPGILKYYSEKDMEFRSLKDVL